MRAYLFIFILIDITFLPYFWLLSIPYSMPFVFLWAVKNANKVYKFATKEGIYPSLIILTIIVSTIVGYQYTQHAYKNSVLAINFIYAFFLLFYFGSNKEMLAQFNIVKLLQFFYIFVFLWSLLFYFDKEQYIALLKIWNARSAGAFLELFEDISYLRFSFIWTDPNNIAYVISSLFLFLYFSRTVSAFNMVMLYLMSIFIVLMTMSTGGGIALSVASLIVFLDSLLRFLKSGGKVNRLAVISCSLFAGLLLTVLFYFSEQLMQNDTIVYALSRFEDNLVGDTAGSGRVEIIQKVLAMLTLEQFIINLFVGFGGATLVNGQVVSPHNGHLYWWISFGFISYFIFLSYFFIKPFLRSARYSLWLVPMILGFTVNIMFGELKIFSLFILLHVYFMYVLNRNLNS